MSRKGVRGGRKGKKAAGIDNNKILPEAEISLNWINGAIVTDAMSQEHDSRTAGWIAAAVRGGGAERGEGRGMAVALMLLPAAGLLLVFAVVAGVFWIRWKWQRKPSVSTPSPSMRRAPGPGSSPWKASKASGIKTAAGIDQQGGSRLGIGGSGIAFVGAPALNLSRRASEEVLVQWMAWRHLALPECRGCRGNL